MRKRSKKKTKSRLCEQNLYGKIGQHGGHCIFDAVIIYGGSKC